MYIKRIGKSLETFNSGYIYKVIGSEGKLYKVLDNNGNIGMVRMNSRLWDFNPDMNSGQIASGEPDNHIENQVSKQNDINSSTTNINSDSLGFATGLMIGSTVLGGYDDFSC